MAPDLTLEPFAARVGWSAKAPLASGEWRALLVAFAEELVRRAVACGAGPVGHVKGIARPESGGYLHVSAVAAGRPADARGEVADGLRELSVDLNVLVYGLLREALGALVEDAARTVGGARECSASVEPVASGARFHELHVPEKVP